MSENKVKFGIEQMHIAFIDEEAAETPGWSSPQAIKGVVGFSSSPEGDQSQFYADNTIYFTYTSNNGYTADLEVALIPDDILAEMLGQEVDENGMIVETADDQPKEFAIMGQIQGDNKNRRFVYYRCVAERPSQESNTKTETVEPDTDTLTLTIMPIEADDKKLVKGVMELNDTNETAYEAFFDEVTLPDFTPEA